MIKRILEILEINVLSRGYAIYSYESTVLYHYNFVKTWLILKPLGVVECSARQHSN